MDKVLNLEINHLADIYTYIYNKNVQIYENNNYESTETIELLNSILDQINRFRYSLIRVDRLEVKS